jgi:hypothetical protein
MEMRWNVQRRDGSRFFVAGSLPDVMLGGHVMRTRVSVLSGFLVALALMAPRADADSNVTSRMIRGESAPSERDEQEALFNYYFRDQDLRFETRLDPLKTAAQVAPWRIPYSAAIYPERSGGLAMARSTTGTVLGKYDLAFHEGQSLAESYDRRRKQRTEVRRVGLFRGRTQTHTYYDAEHWEGYCSGATASTIRHPEPVRPVDAGTVGGRPGVVFQPSEIKALLSAAYNRTRPDSFLFLAPPSARDRGPNMGTFHLALANYIGQAGHPIGMDRTKGREAWNNPVYAYEVTSIRDAGRRGDIQYKDLTTRITYTWYGSDQVNQTNRETGERQGHQSRTMSIRYYLYLDSEGHIVGGRALSYSGHFLWIPLFAVQGIRDQSSPGNPHLDVQKVIALARESALPEIQDKYDRVVIGKRTDPQIAIRAEAERIREVAAQQPADDDDTP